MAMNPEEVVNKRFSATKFRQGYDEEEVDEFLDEVVSELRRLNGANEELRTKLSACESRVAELSRSSSRAEPATAAPVAPVVAPVQTPSPAPTPTPAPAPVPVAASASSGIDSATGMLALAQRLHDEHVAAGKSKGDKLVNDAQTRATRMVREAEEKQRQTLGDLESQRQVLERKVEDLRSFEREYRSRLKAYLEGQLRDLESTSASGGTRSASSAPGVADTAGSPSTSALPSRTPTVAETGRDAPSGDSTPRFPFGG